MTNDNTPNTTAAPTNRVRKAAPLALLGIGLATAGVLIAPSISAAQEDDSTTDAVAVEERSGPPEDFLADLVDDGTITQAQADAIAEHLQENRGDRGHGRRGHGPGGHDSTVVTDLLGMTDDELRTELRAGSSLAEVAEANGVDTQTLVDAIVAERQAHIDEAVAEGDLTADEAAERSADIEERVTERVNGEFEGRRGPRGPGGPGNGPLADQEVPDNA